MSPLGLDIMLCLLELGPAMSYSKQYRILKGVAYADELIGVESLAQLEGNMMKSTPVMA